MKKYTLFVLERSAAHADMPSMSASKKGVKNFMALSFEFLIHQFVSSIPGSSFSTPFAPA